MRSRIVAIYIISLISLIKHFAIFPTFDETTITGFEFKIKFNIGRGGR